MRWMGCGHYETRKVIMIVDCHDAQCENSQWHTRGCNDSSCTKAFGRDIENDLARPSEMCRDCRVKAGRAPPRLALTPRKASSRDS
uniref:Zinc-binding domain-containing protein n=1 Tax=Mycena chlorophos TaxID=658473 RepID=A0ABQ0LWX1_MYCCL|nr:predicted protein [Mycena chlorophos]